MPPPAVPPIGLRLARAAKAVGRAFDQELASVGGSLPAWLILISLKSRRLNNQRELARMVGIEGATLTHHLNAMEREGLLTRRRDPRNRRVHLVELTASGEAAFERMRGAAFEFDRRLRAGLLDGELAHLGELLDRLRANVAPESKPQGS